MYDYQELFETKMPAGRTPSGSINYKIFHGDSKRYRKVTKCYPTYDGAKIMLMSNILSCYYMAGEVTYNESIKQRTFVPKLNS